MYSARLRPVNLLFKRQVHGNAELIENCKEIVNRNPRNLERLRIARKPSGYHLEKPDRSYWHKLVITSKARYIKAEISHFENGIVLSASSNEMALKGQLYKTQGAAAYINVGRILAQRCLESGIVEMYMDEKAVVGENARSLVQQLRENGIKLEEPERYVHPYALSKTRPEKPWEFYE